MSDLLAAYRCVIDAARSFGVEWWNLEDQDISEDIKFNDTVIQIVKKGYSGVKEPPEYILYTIELGSLKPPGVSTITMWVYNPQKNNTGANQRAAIAAMEGLRDGIFTNWVDAMLYLQPPSK